MARRLVTEKHGKAYWTNMTTHSTGRALMLPGELTQIPLSPSHPVLTYVEQLYHTTLEVSQSSAT